MRISDWSSDVCSSDLEQIEQLKAPIILFHGGKDDVVPASSSEELLEAASGPAAFISMQAWTHKPVMQKLGPWISHAIEPMPGGKVYRSEASRVRNDCVSTCRSRGTGKHDKKTK